MNSKCVTAGEESLIPEMELSPEALFGGSELLDEDSAEDTYWSIFTPHDLSFFNQPLLYQLRQRPYHLVMVKGPIDTNRLANDYRQHLYRSEVVSNSRSEASIDRLLLCLGQGVFVLYEGANLHVIAPTPQSAAKLASELRRYETRLTKEDKPAFHLVSVTADGPHAELVEVDTCPPASADQLALHYGADFVAWEEEWLARLAKRHSGVSILFGPPGVGKTSYLKMLMARFMDRFVFYYLPISSFDLLSAPQFAAFWINQNRRHKGKAKLAIIEDAEELLLPRDERSRAQVSNLLNVGDGFLGEHLKLHVVATTNAPMRRLDKAVLRPGRLRGMRELRRLSRAEAARLAAAKGLRLEEKPDTWSLAEIYHGSPEVLALEANVGFSPSS